MRKGIHARAMQDFDKALNLRPNKAAFTNRGIGFMGKGEWEKARADLISASNMGVNLVTAFRASYRSVADFQQRIGLEPPEDIVDMVSIEETSPPNAGLSVLEMFKKIRESASANTFDNLPADASRNYKHYIYGLPKK